MLREDLDAARKAWIDAAKDDVDVHMGRIASDFLRPINDDFQRLDFHALRHTCGAWLALTGASVKSIQSIMRHSTITLTMDRYGHLLPDEAADTIARLPVMLSNPDAMQATGTDNHAVASGTTAAHLQRARCESVRSGATERRDSLAVSDHADRRNLLPSAKYSIAMRECATWCESRAGQTRTGNQRIMSPLL